MYKKIKSKNKLIIYNLKSFMIIYNGKTAI